MSPWRCVLLHLEHPQWDVGCPAAMESWRVWVKIASQLFLHATCHILHHATLAISRYPRARWCILNFWQQSLVNTHDGGYKGVRGCDRGCEQGMKGKEFHCRGGQEALVAKNCTPDLRFG
jgi:hypothetical protein